MTNKERNVGDRCYVVRRSFTELGFGIEKYKFYSKDNFKYIIATDFTDEHGAVIYEWYRRIFRSKESCKKRLMEYVEKL